MKIKLITLCPLIVYLSIIARTPAAAQTPQSTTNTNNRIEKIRQNREAMQEEINQKREEAQNKRNELATARASARAENMAQRCARVSEKIKLLSAKYENAHKGATQNYQTMKSNLAKIVADLKAKGADTAALESAIAGMEAKISTINTARQAYLEALSNTSNYSCGNSEGAYKDSLSQARSKLQLVSQAVLEARIYYQESVRPEIIKLRQRLAVASASARASALPQATSAPAAKQQ